jgi:hypothetical protein
MPTGIFFLFPLFRRRFLYSRPLNTTPGQHYLGAANLSIGSPQYQPGICILPDSAAAAPDDHGLPN